MATSTPPLVANLDNQINTVEHSSQENQVHLRHCYTYYPIKKRKDSIAGYRLADMEILSSLFITLKCPGCDEQSISLIENLGHKQGLSTELSIVCSNCDYRNSFISSKKVNKSYDVNNRIVYSMLV